MCNVGKKLKDLRLQKGQTIAETAKALCVSKSAIANYENDYRVPRDEIKKRYANYFGVSVQTIFFDN